VARDFYQYPYASKWIGMNVFSINPDTVIVDRMQIDLIRQIQRHGLDVIPMELRHSRTLGGGFHCVTLDLHRQR
jgi:N-dimethylarginine dimethylaminohydrolase